MVGAKLNDRAGILFGKASTYLKDQLQSAPQFGIAGLNLVSHEGEITRVYVAASSNVNSMAKGDGHD